MKEDNCLYWVWLAGVCGVASKEFGRLVTRFEDPFDLYRMESEEIEYLEGIEDRLKVRLSDKALERAYSILRYCEENSVRILPYSHPDYPMRLRTLEDPPAVLYVEGELPDMNGELCIGMVGTRKMSEYGRQSAYKISYELGAAGCVVVSGMALGVDGVSACGTLAAGGRTVAVLGCGISRVYPKEHGRLKEEILKNGAVVTEYPPLEPPRGMNFPKRNRLISGMCQGVIVIEGNASSGAMITARRTVDQGRDLFALPGKVGESNSEGPNELLRSGAYVALSSADILKHYEFLYGDRIDEKRLARAKRSPVNIDEALRRCGVSTLYYRGSYDEAAAQSPTLPEKRPKTPPKGRRDEQPKDTPVEKRTEAVPVPEEKSAPSAEALAALDPHTLRVLEQMPADRAISPDALLVGGMDMGNVITALTLLELSGLVSSLPGGLYIRQ